MSQSSFSPDSRYYGIETAETKDRDGQDVQYIKRRFVPQVEKFSQTGAYEVKSSDRPDLVAHTIFKDAKASWRVCDANGLMHPEAMVVDEGTVLRVTLPEGVKVPKND